MRLGNLGNSNPILEVTSDSGPIKVNESKPEHFSNNITCRYGSSVVDSGSSLKRYEPNSPAPEITELVNKYLDILPNLISTPEVLEKQLRQFDNATWINNISATVPISDQYNRLLTVMYFVNGMLLDLNKLPPPPLIFKENTVNGRPLEEFIIKSNKG